MKYIVLVVALVPAVLATVWLTRALMSRNLPELQSWHRPALDSEYRARHFPGGVTFAEYRELEAQLVTEIRTRIGAELKPAQQVVTNRYFDGSPAHASAWPSNWNLSFERIPENPRGAVVLLHGASDSPYSMRALADVFFRAGLYVIAPRLPGNGTIPGELTVVRLKDWTTVLPMAVAEARKHLTAGQPLYLGGYSTGASLSIKYALDALEDRQLEQVDGLYLFSPAVDVSGYAFFARWDFLLSKLPGLEKFGWMSVLPEYDPFKYSSFPKQAGHLVYAVASANQDRIAKLKSTSRWQDFPPVITFQSVVDSTVSVPAILDLHQTLQNEASQLVLFDVNRRGLIAPFLRGHGAAVLDRIAAENWSDVDVTVVANRGSDDQRVVASRRCAARANCATETELTATWPAEVFSLSHVAMPFPPDDPLYGGVNAAPAPSGYHIGRVHAKGERNVLAIPAADINRLRHNPFFSYLESRIIEFCGTCRGV